MMIVFWIGLGITGIGAGLILWCLRTAVRVRTGGDQQTDATRVLNRLVALNAGGLALAAIGLGLMLAGGIL
ncbi:MAG: hypothetical protein AAF317_17560 [Pseudomonadota bacterium]